MDQPTGVADVNKSSFRQSVRVAIRIDAPPERIWTLLTNAADFPRWNSTVTGIEGKIAAGERISIKVPISDRLFKVKVDTFDPPKTLVWSDGNAVFRGVRTFTLTPQGGATVFAMEEVFTGFMLPLIAGSLPDFKPVFETYAADLKKEAEGRN